MIVKLSGKAVINFHNVEIEADSVEDAISKLDTELWGGEFLSRDEIGRGELYGEPEVQAIEAKFTVHCFDIDYDVSEEDVDHMLGMNPTDEEVAEAIKNVKATLDKEVDVVVECEEDDLEDYVSEALSDKTGWLINYFDYKVIKKE